MKKHTRFSTSKCDLKTFLTTIQIQKLKVNCKTKHSDQMLITINKSNKKIFFQPEIKKNKITQTIGFSKELIKYKLISKSHNV